MAQARPAPRTRKTKATAAPARPTVSASGPAPTLRILETRVLRGPNYWAREPVIRLLVDLGVLEQYPSNTAAELHRRARSRCCRPSRTTPARSAAAAASSPGSATGRGSATSPSTSRSSSRTWPARTSATARPARAGPVGQYNCIFEYREEAVGLEAGRMAVALVNHLVAPDDPDIFFDFAPGDGAAHPARRAAGVRAVHPGAHRRGGQPRHPVHPARPPFARPVRARRPPAADPGDDDLADLGHRGRRRVGQEPDQPAARLGRAAGPAGGRRRQRGRRGGGGQAARLPVRGQAARRQPRPRRPPRPPLRGGRPGRVPRRARPEPRRATS